MLNCIIKSAKQSLNIYRRIYSMKFSKLTNLLPLEKSELELFEFLSDKINPKLGQSFLIFGKWFIYKLHSKPINQIDVLLINIPLSNIKYYLPRSSNISFSNLKASNSIKYREYDVKFHVCNRSNIKPNEIKENLRIFSKQAIPFTIYSLFYNITNGNIIDPLQIGIKDYKEKKLVPISNPPSKSFQSNPLLLLDVYKYISIEFNFSLDEELQKCINDISLLRILFIKLQNQKYREYLRVFIENYEYLQSLPYDVYNCLFHTIYIGYKGNRNDYELDIWKRGLILCKLFTNPFVEKLYLIFPNITEIFKQLNQLQIVYISLIRVQLYSKHKLLKSDSLFEDCKLRVNEVESFYSRSFYYGIEPKEKLVILDVVLSSYHFELFISANDIPLYSMNENDIVSQWEKLILNNSESFLYILHKYTHYELGIIFWGLKRCFYNCEEISEESLTKLKPFVILINILKQYNHYR